MFGRDSVFSNRVEVEKLILLWHLGLEINERPLKRPTLDFSKLSISDSGERGNSILSQALCACTMMVSTQWSFNMCLHGYRSFCGRGCETEEGASAAFGDSYGL